MQKSNLFGDPKPRRSHNQSIAVVQIEESMKTQGTKIHNGLVQGASKNNKIWNIQKIYAITN